MEELRAFPKPCEIEGIETLTPKQMTARRLELFYDQRGVCACGCGRMMTLELDRMDTATVDHITVNKMGCRKQDAAHNLRAVRWECNTKKGSKRG